MVAAFMASPSTCRRSVQTQPCWRPSAWRPIFCRQFTALAIIGSVTAEAAAATGAAVGTPVCCGQVDFSASCIAAGIIAEGDIMSNLGTVGNFGVVHKTGRSISKWAPR